MLKSHKRKMKNTKKRTDRYWFNKEADMAERMVKAENNLMRAKYAVDQACDMLLAGKSEQEAEDFLFCIPNMDIRYDIDHELQYGDNPKLKQIRDLLEERHVKDESGDKANNSNPEGDQEGVVVLGPQ